MFTKLALLSVAALAGNVIAAPINPKTQSLARRYFSFDNYDGISSFNGFDNFYGVDNFSGFVSSQVVVEQQEEVVCQSISIEIVQQRLLVLQEMARRIITEQICEVETQTVVFQQFVSSCSQFSSDLLRTSGRHVGFDSNIVSHFGSIVNSDGSLSTDDLGFCGLEAGQSIVVPTGNNWDSTTSPSSCGNAYSAALSASSSMPITPAAPATPVTPVTPITSVSADNSTLPAVASNSTLAAATPVLTSDSSSATDSSSNSTVATPVITSDSSSATDSSSNSTSASS
jgi:hypothetical protein